MYDWANLDYRGRWSEPVGAWMWWGWADVANGFAPIDAYLAQAASYDKPVAISLMIYPDWGRDTTPASVYARCGLSAGWVITNSLTGATTTVPAWGNSCWEREYNALVAALGARYNSDPRVSSVWICTGLYGETVTSKDGWYLGGYRFREWVKRVIDVYRLAFPTKQLYLIATGTEDRTLYTQLSAARGIGVKFNGLVPDWPTHHFPRDNNGIIDVLMPISQTVKIAWEHAYANTITENYWAMLTALATGADLIDLPTEYLDMLEQRIWTGETLMTWTARMMRQDAPLWVGRLTAYSCAADSWACGWPGNWGYRLAFVGDISQTRSVPVGIYGYNGAVRLDGVARADRCYTGVAWVVGAGTITVRWGSATAAISGDWQAVKVAGSGVIELTGEGWLHLVAIEDAEPCVQDVTPTVTICTQTATPTLTIVPYPLITPTLIKTLTQTPTPGPSFSPVDVLAQLDALERRVQTLEAWAGSWGR